jgi:hypothetical protein
MGGRTSQGSPGATPPPRSPLDLRHGGSPKCPRDRPPALGDWNARRPGLLEEVSGLGSGRDLVPGGTTANPGLPASSRVSFLLQILDVLENFVSIAREQAEIEILTQVLRSLLPPP